MGFEDGSIRKARPSTYLFRAAAARLRAHIEKSTPEHCARELFGDDPVTGIVLRASFRWAEGSRI
jgi:hypothetical protein